MKYTFAALPLLASLTAVTAQSVLGVHFIAASDDAAAAAPGASTSSPGLDLPSGSAPTATELGLSNSAPESTPTAAPAPGQLDNEYGYTDVMPYSSLTQDGYQQLACGYGYARENNQDHCQQQPWFQMEGCYETVLINVKNICSTVVHHATVDHTVTVTGMQETLTLTQTMVETLVATRTRDVVQEVTATQLVTQTRVWVSTEINDRTNIILHTLTATDVVDLVATRTHEEIRTSTHTNLVAATVTDTVQRVETVVQPTTYLRVWETTVTNENTETRVETRSATVTSTATYERTVQDIDTVTHTQTAFETRLVPTTFVNVWTKTLVNEENVTVEQTFTSTLVSTQTQEVTRTDQATETATVLRQVAETGLSNCLYSCQNSQLLAPPTLQYSNASHQNVNNEYNNAYAAPPPAISSGY